MAANVSPTAMVIDPGAFQEAFERFQGLITAKSGHAFTGFHEGLAAVWESYKPRLRDHALSLLHVDEWSEADIGSGIFLNRMIEAIEIQDSRSNLTNNLVFWQNRFRPCQSRSSGFARGGIESEFASRDRGPVVQPLSGRRRRGCDVRPIGRSNGRQVSTARLHFFPQG